MPRSQFSKLETVHDLKREGMDAEVKCLTCGHTTVIDGEELAKQATRNRYWIILRDIEKRLLRCTKCESRTCKLSPVDRF